MVGGKQDLLPKLSFHKVTNCCLLFVNKRLATILMTGRNNEQQLTTLWKLGS
jgi:hypothetical protein